MPCIGQVWKQNEIPKINDTDQKYECEEIQPHKIARWSMQQKMNGRKRKVEIKSEFESKAIQGEFVLYI